MSKQRDRFHARPSSKTEIGPPEETAEETASRVVVEALGRPLRPKERPRPHRTCPTIACPIVGLRDNTQKYYHIDLLELPVGDDEVPRPMGGLPVAWLTLDEIRADEKEYRGLVPAPLTTTATYIADQIREASGG